MPYITVKSLPRICFAHIYGVDSYFKEFPSRKNIMEISYISSGEIKYTRKKSITAGSGDVLFNPMDIPVTVAADIPHEHHTVCFEMEFDVSYSDKDAAQDETMLYISDFIKKPNGRCKKLIDEIIRTYTLYENGGMKCTGLFLELLYELSVSSKNSTQKNEYSGYLYIEHAKNYIFEHITTSIKQKEIADHLGITPEYLCAVFKRHEGVSVMGFINRVKLEAVCTVMKREKIPLYVAAEMYGYSDPNYVSRLYKKYFNSTLTDAVANLIKDK